MFWPSYARKRQYNTLRFNTENWLIGDKYMAKKMGNRATSEPDMYGQIIEVSFDGLNPLTSRNKTAVRTLAKPSNPSKDWTLIVNYSDYALCFWRSAETFIKTVTEQHKPQWYHSTHTYSQWIWHDIWITMNLTRYLNFIYMNLMMVELCSTLSYRKYIN